MTSDSAGRQIGECSPWETHRLWSLWDMFELKAGPFLRATEHLQALTTWVAASTTTGSGDEHFHEDRQVDDTDRGFIDTRLVDLRAQLELLGARVSLLAIEEAQEAIKAHWVKWRD